MKIGESIAIFFLGLCVAWVALTLFPTRIDYSLMTVQVISCADFEPGFLKHLGAESTEQCESLNLALADQAAEACESYIGASNKLSSEEFKNTLEKCRYHLLEAQLGTVMSTAFIEYRSTK